MESININIITTNSAFEDANLNHELARILRELADKVEDNDIPYYLNDINKAYTLANYLIQGTCADMMKEAMIRIYEYLKEQKCKTKMIMTVHDEIFFSSVPGEEHIIKECQRIMEDNDWHMIPIIAEIEKTTTTWADKEDVVL